jgi:hypothetical protein
VTNIECVGDGVPYGHHEFINMIHLPTNVGDQGKDVHTRERKAHI